MPLHSNIWPLDTVSIRAIERQPQNPLTHARAQQEYCEVCPSAAASQSKKLHGECTTFVLWRPLTLLYLLSGESAHMFNSEGTVLQTLAFFTCPHYHVYVWETEEEQDCGHVCIRCFPVVCVGVCVWECAQNPTHVHFLTRHCRLGVEV